MPNNRFLHLLNIHPKYMHLKRHMSHFHQSANHKAHGEGFVPRIHHRKLHPLTGSGPQEKYTPIEVMPGFGKGMTHKHRRPAPLTFKL